MGFPSPKPRNIEKDVKVFPWDILGSALKKIIGKYVSLSRSTMFAADDIFKSSATQAYSGNNVMSPSQPIPQYHPVPPHPVPLQAPSGDGEYNNLGSTGSAPQLQSHTSSDSSVYAQSLSTNGPSTPHVSHANSPAHYRAASTPQHEKHDAFVTLDPPHQSPYGTALGQTDSYWPSHVDTSVLSSGSYGAMPMTMGYHEQPHQLPHHHETGSRSHSSNDLRVMYPSMT